MSAKQIKKAVQKNAILLAIFALSCTMLLALVNLLTKDTIARQEEEQLLKTLYEIIDASSIDNDLYNDCVLVTSEQYLGSKNQQKVYLARKNSQGVAAAITTTAPDGYNGHIELLVAINTDNIVTGVRVLKHQETPGLGDKIELRKDDWILSFSGEKLRAENDANWAVKKDNGIFDQFTGATITPRAVVKSVKNTAIYFTRNKDQLFDSTASCRGEQ
jgi:electron transport complex protein RnfG